MSSTCNAVTAAARQLSHSVDALKFTTPVAFVYNPLNYAWSAHAEYIRRFAAAPRRIILLGMNPGPFGMAQVGVPFGEVAVVRDWMGIKTEVLRPRHEHPKRPVLGFDCPRSEVSGRRLWGLFAQRFGAPENFFREHFVVNYCPLAFLSETGANLTPDKLPARETAPLFAACDEHLRRVVEALEPEWLVGVGGFAFERVQNILGSFPKVRAAQVLHPSPASPAANRDWAGQATAQLQKCGAWPPG